MAGEIGEKRIKSRMRRLFHLYRELEAAGGPEKDGELFGRFVELEDELFEGFGLPATVDNQRLLQAMLEAPNRQAAVDTYFELLRIKSRQEREAALPPREILRQGIAAGEQAGNVLPRMGLTHHVYQEFLYNLAVREPGRVAEIHGEMVRAEQYLGELARMKRRFDRLKRRGLPSLQSFLDPPERSRDRPAGG